jgi:hypothetical protein
LGPTGAAAAVVLGYIVILGIAFFFSRREVGDRLHRSLVSHLARDMRALKVEVIAPVLTWQQH